MKTGFIVIGMAVIAAIIGIVWYFSLSNSEIKLRNRIVAEQTVCTSYFDKMWKVISQKAQIADKYKDSFKEVYTPLIEGRYSNEGSGTLMKWIQESNPQFDASLFKDIMVAVEAQREGFFIEQKKLIDMDMMHKNMRQTVPNSWFIGNRPDVGIVVITSTKTDDIYKTGKEDDVKLF
jgi:hypothetical protein